MHVPYQNHMQLGELMDKAEFLYVSQQSRQKQNVEITKRFKDREHVITLIWNKTKFKLHMYIHNQDPQEKSSKRGRHLVKEEK